MLKYKINVIESLKEAGYNTSRIRNEGLLSEATLQYLRKGKPVGNIALDEICRLLKKQPGDIYEFVDSKIDSED